MQIEDYEAAVSAAVTGEGPWRVFSGFFVGTEVARVSYLHFPPIGAPDGQGPRMMAEGFPEALVARYLEERHYRNNPILAAARSELEPVYWEDALERARLSEGEQTFVAAFQAAGLGYGVGIPVYGPNGRDGHCGLGFVAGVTRLPTATLRTFQWACQFAHLRYCALLLSTLRPTPRMSGREVEVLGWVARGKSNGSIAEILGISSHTVDAHLRRICLKLGVSDRISAAVRGIGVGLVYAGA